MLGKQAFKSLLCGLFWRAIKGITGILVSRTVFKIYYKSSSEYLVVKDRAKYIIENSEVKLGAQNIFRIKGLSNLSFPLLIKEKV